MTLSFDKMTQADLDAVMSIENVSCGVPWSSDLVSEYIDSNQSCVVLKLCGIVVGYAILLITPVKAHLMKLCVDVKHQSKGYGNSILRYVQNICLYNEKDSFSLEVQVSNTSAISLYKNFGFVQTGIHKEYYETKEDAIAMTKHLHGSS